MFVKMFVFNKNLFRFLLDIFTIALQDYSILRKQKEKRFRRKYLLWSKTLYQNFILFVDSSIFEHFDFLGNILSLYEFSLLYQINVKKLNLILGPNFYCNSHASWKFLWNVKKKLTLDLNTVNFYFKFWKILNSNNNYTQFL